MSIPSSFQSDRLITSSLTAEDTQTLFEFYSDAEAMQYRGSAPMQTVDDADQLIADQVTQKDGMRRFRTGIRRISDQQLIGTLLLITQDDTEDRCEAGFSFGKQFWGQGFATELLSCVEKELFDYGIMEIIAWCKSENAASIRVFQKAGFTEIVQAEFPGSRLFKKSS